MGEEREREVFRPAAREEVDDELSFHVAMRVRDLMAAGRSADEAKREAEGRFGDLAEVRAECRRLAEERDRRARRGVLLSEVRQDVSYAVRMLRRTPGFTAVAVLTLALGIGATTAIFSMVHAVLLRSQPFPDAARVVVPESVNEREGNRWSITYADYEDWKAAGVFEHVAVYWGITANITGGAQPERLPAAQVGPGFFEAVGARPVAGRHPSPDEYEPGTPRVATVSHGLAVRLFGSPAAAVGSTLEVAGRPVEVVGVLPPSLEYQQATEVWLPLRLTPEEVAMYRRRDNYVFQGIARLRRDRTLAQTHAELDRLARQAATLDASTRREHVTVTATPLTSFLVGEELTRGMWLILSTVVFVLLIGCVNLANLLTSRATVRQRELSIRTALGASRARVARQLLTESLVLGAVGGVLGVLLARGGVAALTATAPEDIPRLSEASVNTTVLLFAVTATVGAALLFGLVPSLLATRGDHTPSLREEDSRSGGSRSGRRVRAVLVTTELALSALLLIGAGLFLRSFLEVRGVDPGVRTENLLTFGVALQGPRYAEPATRAPVYDELLERIRRVPGVEHVALASSLPLGGGGFYLGRVFLPEGAPEPPAGPETAAQWVVVTPDYFATAGTAMVSGRDFTARDDANAPPVAIIGRAFAHHMFGDENPLGKRVRSWRDENLYREIVGVVDDVRFFGADDEVRPMFYVPYRQSPWGGMNVVVRGRVSPAAVSAALRRILPAIDPGLAIAPVRSGADLMRSTIATRQFSAALLSGFGGLALLLAVTGVYGVLSYNVAQRRREIGIRMALGARAGDVSRMVVAEALRVLLPGLLIGVMAAFALSRLIASQLYGIAPTDALTFATAAAVLLLVALLASLVPARAAARVDPLRTIR